jgi:hypothetical protein
MTFPKDGPDALMKGYRDPENLMGETGLLERAMQVEITFPYF